MGMSDNLQFEITKQSYEEIKRLFLEKIDPKFRATIERALELVKNLPADQAEEALLDGKTIADIVNESWSRRVGLATVKTLLKLMPEYREAIRKHLTYQIVKLTLQFENPTAWEAIHRYGEKAEQWLYRNYEALLELLLEKPKTREP